MSWLRFFKRSNGQKKNEAGKSNAPTAESNKQKKNDTALRRLFFWTIVGIVLGTLWIIEYAAGFAWTSAGWTQFLTILGVACMIAGAFFITGAFVGFLFGFPHTRQAEFSAGNQPPAGKAPAVAYEVNTNLEQISDWLTKILVGVGLTQIGSLPGMLKKFAAFAAPALGGDPKGGILAIAILVYYFFVGFLSGFLLTRLYIAGAIRKADVEDVALQLADVVQQKQADDEALALVQLQLTADHGTPLPTQEELNAKIAAASPATKSQIYFQARNVRSQNREANKLKMERTIPIFRALIASEAKDERNHNYHGQLGFALKDQESPAWEEAERELSTAIEIRDAQKETGWLDYEFVRAYCRIKMAETQPASDEAKIKIMADLQKSAADNTLRTRLDEQGIIKQWLEDNKDWLQQQNLTIP